jgi:hypothetical protein
MDLDGDGYLSMYELEYFYEEQLQRMEQLGIETLPFEDCLCQVGGSTENKDRSYPARLTRKRPYGKGERPSLFSTGTLGPSAHLA